jgi:hypothetical protein
LAEDVFLALCRKFVRPLPVQVEKAEGYLVSVFETEQHYTVHLLAEDYDVDIDHHLDSIRFHRSRVNFITKVEPAGVDGNIRIATEKPPTVYTPFTEGTAEAFVKNGKCHINLPKNCSYAILAFPR